MVRWIHGFERRTRVSDNDSQMSGTIYSYKPVGGGLEGASTVLVLKTGELMELRRGAKTRWSVRDPAGTEPRKRWASLEAWKATLPEGAEVVVHGDPEGEAATVVEESDDIRQIRNLGITTTRTSLHTNKLDASRWMAKCRTAERRRDRSHFAEWLRRYDADAKMYRQRAEEALAAAPYSHFEVVSYSPRCKSPVLMARRTTDGVFIPLFVDLERNLFHIPEADLQTAKTSPTLAGLGLDRVLLMRTSERFALRMVSL